MTVQQRLLSIEQFNGLTLVNDDHFACLLGKPDYAQVPSMEYMLHVGCSMLLSPQLAIH